MHQRRADDWFDPSLMDEMLALSPADRLARHDQALAIVLMLERAGRKLRDPEPRPAALPGPHAG